MCFYNDYDWYADVNDITEGETDEKQECHECGLVIHPGEWRRQVYQQEHEECHVCEFEDGPPCGDGNHDYGETYFYVCCRTCANILKAIEVSEAEAGCPPDARQPAYGELQETLWEDREGRYVRRAVEMFPGLQSNLIPVGGAEE